MAGRRRCRLTIAVVLGLPGAQGRQRVGHVLGPAVLLVGQHLLGGGHQLVDVLGVGLFVGQQRGPPGQQVLQVGGGLVVAGQRGLDLLVAQVGHRRAGHGAGQGHPADPVTAQRRQQGAQRAHPDGHHLPAAGLPVELGGLVAVIGQLVVQAQAHVAVGVEQAHAVVTAGHGVDRWNNTGVERHAHRVDLGAGQAPGDVFHRLLQALLAGTVGRRALRAHTVAVDLALDRLGCRAGQHPAFAGREAVGDGDQRGHADRRHDQRIAQHRHGAVPALDLAHRMGHRHRHHQQAQQQDAALQQVEIALLPDGRPVERAKALPGQAQHAVAAAFTLHQPRQRLHRAGGLVTQRDAADAAIGQDLGHGRIVASGLTRIELLRQRIGGTAAAFDQQHRPAAAHRLQHLGHGALTAADHQQHRLRRGGAGHRRLGCHQRLHQLGLAAQFIAPGRTGGQQQMAQAGHRRFGRSGDASAVGRCIGRRIRRCIRRGNAGLGRHAQQPHLAATVGHGPAQQGGHPTTAGAHHAQGGAAAQRRHVAQGAHQPPRHHLRQARAQALVDRVVATGQHHNRAGRAQFQRQEQRRRGVTRRGAHQPHGSAIGQRGGAGLGHGSILWLCRWWRLLRATRPACCSLPPDLASPKPWRRDGARHEPPDRQTIRPQVPRGTNRAPGRAAGPGPAGHR